MIPTCPHCAQQFATWPLAKRHVKHCLKAPHERDKLLALDCVYCEGPPFRDFKELAAHVLEIHVLPYAPAAKRAEVETLLKTKYKEQQLDMALKPPTAEAQGAMNPFLKADAFNGHGKGTVTLLGGRIPSSDTSFSDIFLDVKLGKTEYTWGLKSDSRNYAALYKRFGEDEKKWKGTVKVEIAKGKYINVVGA